MSWLSHGIDKVASPVGAVLNPALGGGLGIGKDIFNIGKNLLSGNPLKNVLGIGNNPGVTNPFPVPDLSFLRNDDMFKYLLSSPDLTSKFQPVNYSAPNPTSDSLFQDLIGNINAPSSVDAVRSSVEGDQMKQLLDQIDQDTKQGAGSLKLDFLDRGLGGPGQISDIEASGLGDLYAGATKAKAGARLGFANSELDRLKAREDAARGAYGARYSAGVASDTQGRDIASKNATQNASLYNDLLKTGADNTTKGNLAFADTTNQRDIALAKIIGDLYTGGAKNNVETQQPGFLDNFLRNIRLNIGI